MVDGRWSVIHGAERGGPRLRRALELAERSVAHASQRPLAHAARGIGRYHRPYRTQERQEIKRATSVADL